AEARPCLLGQSQKLVVDIESPTSQETDHVCVFGCAPTCEQGNLGRKVVWVLNNGSVIISQFMKCPSLGTGEIGHTIDTLYPIKENGIEKINSDLKNLKVLSRNLSKL
ncbi:hypothetical protein EK904_000031, partial [Melospiza melodia maxima]